MPSSEILVLGVVLCCMIGFLLRFGCREHGLPPGPPTLPLIGNAHLLGSGKTLHLRLTEWARHYGDIYSIKIGSGTMVVLSSAAAIKEVVDKHGWVGSSRPSNYVAELCGSGGEFNILFATDCPRLKNLRRHLVRFFSPQNALKYVPAQAAESTLLLNDLMTRPENFSDSIRRYTHSLAKIMTYGQRASYFHADDVERFYTSLDQLIHALAPGSYPPFDLLPALKYLPGPFAPWRSVGRQVAYARTAIHTQLYDTVQCRQTSGDEESAECFIGKILQTGVPPGEEEFYSYTGIALLDAASDTTGAFLLSLVLVLAVYPELQERARREIDAVVGGARLPILADFPKLLYLNALIKEVLRFRPQFPMGVPHSMAGNAIYKEYLLPKDTVLVLNTYALFHDPEIFENPEEFNPDRFLKSEHGTLPEMDTDFRDNFLFGGGRQLTVMRLIWALKFDAAKDPATGEPLSRELDFFTSDFVVMPRPFKCTIEHRSTEHRDLVLQALDDAKLYLNRYDEGR
ncbi:cytochrome P450 [Mycena crocata]|nr:cytochrome P450 [Mycena crocata]